MTLPEPYVCRVNILCTRSGCMFETCLRNSLYYFASDMHVFLDHISIIRYSITIYRVTRLIVDPNEFINLNTLPAVFHRLAGEHQYPHVHVSFPGVHQYTVSGKPGHGGLRFWQQCSIHLIVEKHQQSCLGIVYLNTEHIV